MMAAVIEIAIERATSRDAPVLAGMFHRLWPGTAPEEHARDLTSLLTDPAPQGLPAIIFLARLADGRPAGFIHAGLRSHADGCDTSRPVGFVEGWYVESEFRRERVGARLMRAAEEWARLQGCREMASDTWIDELGSQSAHEALGFEVVDRCVHYRKALPG